MVVSTILERNQELSFQKPVDMDKVRQPETRCLVIYSCIQLLVYLILYAYFCSGSSYNVSIGDIGIHT